MTELKTSKNPFFNMRTNFHKKIKYHMNILSYVNGISNSKIMLTHVKELSLVDLHRR